MHVVLISTYDLGRQPFGLASPAAWLDREGFRVTCLDLAVQRLDDGAVSSADLVAFHLPMHTATRLAARVVPRVRELNPDAPVCFYGLYAPMNEAFLRRLGAAAVLGGEFETGLVSLARRLAAGDTNGGFRDEPRISLDRQIFVPPDRGGLPPLERYAHVHLADGRKRRVGSTEASRGCKHLCRHCPVVPVYDGRFRIVQRDVVLEDIRRQVAAGAEHITFGDPDFLNGISHALAIVRALHEEHPGLTYDVTVKIEHLLKHAESLPILRDTGCLFITTAAESLDDDVLSRLGKGHTRGDFVEALGLCRDAGAVLNPTFIAFHPWVSPEGYLELLEFLAQHDLVENVASVQLTLRLLVPDGSRMLDLPEVRELVGPFDGDGLVYPWIHPDPRMDSLHREVQSLVEDRTARGYGRRAIYSEALARAARAAGRATTVAPTEDPRSDRAAVPYLTEPWYC